MTRKEHMQWCKKRARDEYAFYAQSEPDNAIRNAMHSLLSDFRKHPETEALCMFVFATMQTVTTKEQLDKFIDGFAE